LKFEGPAQKLTSYRAYFPGNRGRNPYVKNLLNVKGASKVSVCSWIISFQK